MEITDWGRGLPSEVGKAIFSKLPVSNLPACRVVCKAWNDLILDQASSSKFISNDFILFTLNSFGCPENLYNSKMHCLRFDNLDMDLDLELEVSKSAFDGDVVVKPINSCNGLLLIYKVPSCISVKLPSYMGIFNPMTNEFLQVPQGEIEYYYGFGFIPAIKQYKLFRVNVPQETDSVSQLDVLIIDPKQYGWRHLHSLPGVFKSDGAYVNGVIYWLGKGKEENKYVVYTLDVETEKIESSAVLEVVNSTRMSIQQLNGTVYAIFYMKYGSEVWRMQEKNLWIRDFVIDEYRLCFGRITLIKAYENGEILFMIRPRFFWLYNPSTGRKKILTLKSEEKLIMGVCQIEFNFDSLPNILEADDDDESLIMRRRSGRSLRPMGSILMKSRSSLMKSRSRLLRNLLL